MGDNPVFTHEDDIGKAGGDDGHDDGTQQLPSTHQLPSTAGASTSGRQGQGQGGALGELARGQLETVVHDFYEHFNNNWGLGPLDETKIDIGIINGDFKIEEKKLFFKDIRLTRDDGVGFLALSTLKRMGLTSQYIRDMGFTKFTGTPNKMEAVWKLALEVDAIEGGEEDPGEIIQMKTIKIISGRLCMM